MQDFFDISKFGIINGVFTFFYLILIVASFYLIRFFESKLKSIIGIGLKGLYVLFILPMMLNIFNMWCSSGFLIVSESFKTLVFIVISVIIVVTGILSLNKILKALKLKDIGS